jgi:hypothetical protein
VTLDLEHIEATEDRAFTTALLGRLGEPDVLGCRPAGPAPLDNA